MNDLIKITEIKAASIVTPSKLPSSDFVINPYIGCTHACKYCYANFMKKFSGHNNEEWGSFVDIKVNAVEKLKIKPGIITIGSVTDPYQPVEKKYQLTKRILEKLIPHQPKLYIMTKSPLVTRDIELIKQFKECTVSISIAMLDNDLRKLFEPRTASIESRIETIKLLNSAGIKAVTFVSPIMPYVTNWAEIVSKTKDFSSEFWFENLNMYPSIRNNIYSCLAQINKTLIQEYKKIYSKDSSYWHNEEEKIFNFASAQGLNFKLFFHHSESQKTSEQFPSRILV